MVESFTVDTFAGRIGEAFTVEVAGAAPFEATLTEATAHGPPAAPGGRPPFSLEFVGPVHVVQAIYRLSHHDLGDFDLFLVPLGPVSSGMRYEAVFS